MDDEGIGAVPKLAGWKGLNDEKIFAQKRQQEHMQVFEHLQEHINIQNVPQ